MIYSTLDATGWPYPGPITGSLDEQTPEWLDALRYLMAAKSEQQRRENEEREKKSAATRGRSAARKFSTRPKRR